MTRGAAPVMIERVQRVAVVLAVVALAAAAAVVARAVLGPDPATQAQLDGCARSRTKEFTRNAPGWAYVGDQSAPATGPSPAPRWLAGVVQAYRSGPDAVHPSGGDDPTTHDAFDLNLNVLPDAAYAGLMGGLPDQATGNFEGTGEETGRVHLERESTAIPTWAWPEVGDRMQALGSWVWDCGHWDPGGERTELHPFRALWDERTPSPRSPYGESEGDLYVSTDATPAGRIAECAHQTKGDEVAYKACTFSQPNWLDVSGDYVLALQAPPRPPGATHLAVRVVDRGSTVDPHWTSTIAGTTLTLRFRLASTPGTRLVVARQVFLGWRPLTAATLPEHLRLTFTKLLTRRAMDPGCPVDNLNCGSLQSTLGGQISKPPGEWLVYTDVAGLWSLWPRVYPGQDGRSFAVRQTTDLYVSPREAWRLYVFTHECDFGTASFDDPSRPMAPCPKTGEFGNFAGDDVPGDLVVAYRGAPLGSHAGNGSTAPPSTCPKANRSGCYAVSWTVTRVRDEAARARTAR